MHLHLIPRWMDNSFIESLLLKSSNTRDFKIVESNVTVLSKSTDPLASPIFRVTIIIQRSNETDNEVLAFVLKVPVQSDKTSVAAEQHRLLFDNEIQFYTSTLKEMHRLLQHSVEIGPKFLHHSSGLEPVLVLEDLTARALSSPQELLNLDASITVIHRLAKFHAASIYLARNNHNLQYCTGIFHENASEKMSFMCDNFEHFTREVQTWNGFELYAEKLQALQPLFRKRGEEIFRPKTDGFNVLNHGDLCLKNILLRTDGNGIDMRFIDYQHCVWATPAIDLYALLYLVCAPDVRTLRRTELIQFYFKELTLTLHQIGYLNTTPTLLQLQIELLENGFLELIVLSSLLPFAIGGGNYDLNVENLKDIREKAYANEHYLSLMKTQLPHLLHKGYLI